MGDEKNKLNLDKIDELLLEQKQTNKLLAQLIAEQKFSALGADRVVSILHANQECFFHTPLGNVDLIQKRLIETRVFYELKNLLAIQKLLPKNPVICDIGANIGNHTVFFSKFCNAKEVHAFEPITTTFRTLSENVKLNKLDNVVLYNKAVGISGQKGSVSSYRSVNTGGTSLEVSDNGHIEYVSVDTLGLPKVDFMKIDVEGGQLGVFRGAAETIKRDRPIIVVEMRPTEYAESSAALQALGLREVARLSKTDFVFKSAK